jgi:hypothetical protein
MSVLMPSPVFRWFVPTTGAPAAGYKAVFYDGGTATPKTIYQDNLNPPTPYPSPANTAILNSEGWAIIFLGPGTYKLVVTDPFDSPVFQMDDISGEGGFSSGFVDTVLDLPTASLASKFVWVSGYYETGDGGHGFFYLADSSDPDNGGYVINSSDGGKRWFRINDEDGSVRAAAFGYVGTRAEDLTNKLLTAGNYASGQDRLLRIGPGTDAFLTYPFALMTFYANGGIHFEPGSMLTGSGTPFTIQIYGAATGSPEQHFTNLPVEFWTPQTNANPEWFGARAQSFTDNTAAFTKWLACLAEHFILPAGTWGYTNTTTFVFPAKPMNLYGTIHAITTGSDIPPGVHYPDPSIFSLDQITLKGGAIITDDGATGVDIVGKVAINGEVTVTDNINSTGNIIAGVDGNGQIQSNAGTSSVSFAAGGNYGTANGTASTTGTGEVDLLTFGIAANAIVSVSDRLIATASGTYIGSTGDKTVRMYAGTKLLAAHTAVGAGTGAWRLVVNLYKGFSTNYWYDWVFNGITGSTQIYNMNAGESFPVDWATGFNLKVTGQCVAGQIVNSALSAVIMPMKV